MKKILLLILMFPSLISFGQEDYSTINLWLSKGFRRMDVTFNLRLNDVTVSELKYSELIKYKIYSTGEITLRMYRNGYTVNPWVEKLITVKPGQKYYIQIDGKGVRYFASPLDSIAAQQFINDPQLVTSRKEIEEDIENPIGKINKAALAKGPKSGTGFLLSESGLVVTNHHVIDKANKIELKGINGDYTTTYTARIVVDDEKNDLAILQLENKTIKFEPIPYTVRSKGADTGEEIYVLGYPMITAMGEEVKLTTGVISAKTGYQGDITSYQVSAPVQGGNSGGPLFDKQGNLTGIVNSKIQGAEGVTYAIKTNYLNALIDLLPTAPVLNDTNKLTGLTMQEQVKLLSNFIYIIEVNN